MIIAITAIVIVIFIGISILVMDSDSKNVIIPLIAFLILMSMVSGSLMSEQGDYKRGQVDALTGKIKYNLKTNADSTKTWQLIKPQ